MNVTDSFQANHELPQKIPSKERNYENVYYKNESNFEIFQDPPFSPPIQNSSRYFSPLKRLPEGTFHITQANWNCLDEMKSFDISQQLEETQNKFTLTALCDNL